MHLILPGRNTPREHAFRELLGGRLILRLKKHKLPFRGAEEAGLDEDLGSSLGGRTKNRSNYCKIN